MKKLYMQEFLASTALVEKFYKNHIEIKKDYNN
jgi:hypothetical protein